MELACKYSGFDITLARTIIILLYNIVISAALSVVGKLLGCDTPIFHMIITWLAPMIITFYITLYFMIGKGIFKGILSGAFTWIVYIVLYNSTRVQDPIILDNIIFFANLIVIAAFSLMLYFLIKKMAISDYSR